MAASSRINLVLPLAWAARLLILEIHSPSSYNTPIYRLHLPGHTWYSKMEDISDGMAVNTVDTNEEGKHIVIILFNYRLSISHFRESLS